MFGFSTTNVGKISSKAPGTKTFFYRPVLTNSLPKNVRRGREKAINSKPQNTTKLSTFS